MLRGFFEYFKYHRSERQGALILLFVILIVLVGTEIYTSYIKSNSLPPEHLIAVETLLANTPESAVEGPNPASNQLFKFNPNTLSDSGFTMLGFSEKEINTLRNYQKAGAKFQVKTDFLKLYFIDSVEYRVFEPYIDLPEKKKKFNKPTGYVELEPPKVQWSDTAATDAFEYEEFECNLNYADTNELKRLPGIGSFYAKKIVDYREELGGYHSLAQLLELWNMTPDKINSFAHQLTIDTEGLRMLQINSATAQELSIHPYISFKLANQIVNHREENGTFENSQSFCISGLLEMNDCKKLTPYLEF